MTILRLFAVFAFVAGIGLLVFGFLRSDGAESSTPEPTEFVITSVPAPSVTPSDTATGDVPGDTPTPTATPFDGAVLRLKIPRFEVDSEIEPIGLTDDNRLEVPEDPYDTGWYDIYAKPGFGGNALFSAHVDYYPDIRGPFYNLKYLEGGDEIVVVMEDGTEYTYSVFSYKRYDASTIPMGDIIWPSTRPEGEEWITLITCGGRFQSLTPDGPGDYLDRDVIVARRVQ
jgi:sortase (surface protein transpeptidase)